VKSRTDLQKLLDEHAETMAGAVKAVGQPVPAAIKARLAQKAKRQAVPVRQGQKVTAKELYNQVLTGLLGPTGLTRGSLTENLSTRISQQQRADLETLAADRKVTSGEVVRRLLAGVSKLQEASTGHAQTVLRRRARSAGESSKGLRPGYPPTHAVSYRR
jgi:hypothetical protein